MGTIHNSLLRIRDILKQNQENISDNDFPELIDKAIIQDNDMLLTPFPEFASFSEDEDEDNYKNDFRTYYPKMNALQFCAFKDLNHSLDFLLRNRNKEFINKALISDVPVLKEPLFSLALFHQLISKDEHKCCQYLYTNYSDCLKQSSEYSPPPILTTLIIETKILNNIDENDDSELNNDEDDIDNESDSTYKEEESDDESDSTYKEEESDDESESTYKEEYNGKFSVLDYFRNGIASYLTQMFNSNPVYKYVLEHDFGEYIFNTHFFPSAQDCIDQLTTALTSSGLDCDITDDQKEIIRQIFKQM